MGRGALFLTGASGFVGGRVLRALAGRGREVRALVRGGEARLAGTGATAVEGDLVRPESYSAALSGCELVLHVAAVTGRAPAREHLRVNAEGTE